MNKYQFDFFLSIQRKLIQNFVEYLNFLTKIFEFVGCDKTLWTRNVFQDTVHASISYNFKEM